MGNFVAVMGEIDCTGGGGRKASQSGVLLLKDTPNNKSKPPAAAARISSTPYRVAEPFSPPPPSSSPPVIELSPSSEIPLPSSPIRHRSSIELLDYLSDSAYKRKSLRSANLDDAYAKDLITDEEYAARMKDLNFSTLTANSSYMENTNNNNNNSSSSSQIIEEEEDGAATATSTAPPKQPKFDEQELE